MAFPTWSLFEHHHAVPNAERIQERLVSILDIQNQRFDFVTFIITLELGRTLNLVLLKQSFVDQT